MQESHAAPGPDLTLPNELLAQRLEEVADLLEAQAANPFRVRAWRRAASTLRNLDRPAQEILDEGVDGLIALPGIGTALGRAIEQFAHADHLPLLDRLRGGIGSPAAFTTVPGIGPSLAWRIHEQLGIESLYELENAANDGRLATVPGMGHGRVHAVRAGLAGRFRRHPYAASRPSGVAAAPPVAELLDIDREYRLKAHSDSLPRIAPRRFNPTGEAWLPILHAVRGARHYTALYSNTARAHEPDGTHDWVVIYRDDKDGDGQWTVVTEHQGRLQGLRVVRGREGECQQHHAERGASGTASDRA